MKRINIQMVEPDQAGRCPKCKSKRVYNAGLFCVVEIAAHQFAPKLVCLKCGHEFVEDTRLTPEMFERMNQIEMVDPKTLKARKRNL